MSADHPTNVKRWKDHDTTIIRHMSGQPQCEEQIVIGLEAVVAVAAVVAVVAVLAVVQ